jgi:hypothetical protein
MNKNASEFVLLGSVLFGIDIFATIWASEQPAPATQLARFAKASPPSRRISSCKDAASAGAIRDANRVVRPVRLGWGGAVFLRHRFRANA